MKTIKFKKVAYSAALMLATALGNSGTAYANYGASADAFLPVEVEGSLFNDIEIKSNAHEYTQSALPLADITFGINLSIDAGSTAKIKSWETWINTDSDYMFKQSHRNDSVSESYEFGHRPREIDMVEYVVLDFKDHGVMHCNALADSLRTSGYTNEEIFSQDRVIPIYFVAGLAFELVGTGHGTVEFPESEIFDLVCKAFDPQLAPGLDPADDFETEQQTHITSVSLEMLHDTEQAPCPAEVIAKATFVSDTQGSFSTRFQSVFGQVSQPIALHMDSGDQQGDVYIKTYEQSFMVGSEGVDHSDIADKLAGKDQPGVFSGTIADHFDDVSNDDFDGIDFDAPPPSASDDLAVVPGKANVLQDSLWMEILSSAPDSVSKSDYASYKITCGPAFIPDANPVDEFSKETNNQYFETQNTGLMIK